jgi:hypothetical protein
MPTSTLSRNVLLTVPKSICVSPALRALRRLMLLNSLPRQPKQWAVAISMLTAAKLVAVCMCVRVTHTKFRVLMVAARLASMAAQLKAKPTLIL